MNELTQVALLTHDEELADVVLSAAAAAGVSVARVEGAAPPAGLLLVGTDRAAECAASPPSGEVVVLGEDPAELARWSMALGARVVALPDGRTWLTTLLAAPLAGGRGTVVGLVGGSGGVGTSTVACALAATLAAVQGRERGVALVDADPGSGGIDLLLGAEADPGWRWPALAGASGELGDLRGSVVRAADVDVVSQARSGMAPPDEAVQAVVRSLARTHDAVVVDGGRGEPGVLALCDRVAVVVAARVGSVAAGARVVEALVPARRPRAGVVVVGAGLVPADVARSLGLELWAALPHDAALARAGEEGVPPRDAAGRRWRRGLAQLTTAVRP